MKAIVLKPGILLLDELLAGLGQDSQFELVSCLKEVNEEASILFTPHGDILIDHLAHRVIELENGSIT